MSNVPRARRLIQEVIDDLDDGDEGLTVKLMEAERLLHRNRPSRPPVRPRSEPATPALRQRIRDFSSQATHLSVAEVAAVFNVNPGRVSEALRGAK